MASESESSSEPDEEAVIDEHDGDGEQVDSFERMDVLALPIRAKPLFHNNREEVEEFPLSESKDGLQSTSILVGDGLFRVVKTTLHQDGVPRIDVQLVMDAEVTGFQHIIEKPSPIEMGLPAGLAVLGLVLMMIQNLSSMFVGLSLFLIGVKFLPTKLEQHKLLFSSCGNSNEVTLQTFGAFMPSFRASMALVGPAMADYMKQGVLDASDVNDLHAQLRTPPVQPTNEQQLPQLPMPVTPTEILPVQGSVEPVQVAGEVPAVMESTPDETVQTATAPAGPPVMMSTPPKPIPAPLPPPISPPAAPPTVAPPAVVAPPIPIPIPPPLAPMPSPPGGLNQPVPLDMPMPEAPRVAVQATPDEEPLITQEEQDALLDELA